MPYLSLLSAPSSGADDINKVDSVTDWDDDRPKNLRSSVRVYDGVFPPSACLELVDLADEHSLRATNSDGSSIFYRCHPSESHDDDHDEYGTFFPLTPLEQSIDSVLTALGDDSPWVEYWSRYEYLNMDVHADIDEELLEDGDELTGEKVLRCPTTGHVLYLDVEEDVRGPTCVFPDRLVGWDRNGNGGDAIGVGLEVGTIGEEEELAPTDKTRGGDTTLVTVPAVPGRLLRFDGRAMHAVPRPADRWLLSDEEERELRMVEEGKSAIISEEDFYEGDVEGEWNSKEGFWLDEKDEDDSGDDPVRAVLLFNTWADDPPRGVDRDPGTGAPPSGIEIVGDHTEEETPNDSDHVDTYCESLSCNTASEWREVSIDSSRRHENGSVECEERLPVRVNLMGSRERRGHPSEFARLSSSGVPLKKSLLDPLQPSVFVLTASNK